MTSFWVKLRSFCLETSAEEAKNGFPLLATYPSASARKCLAAFRSFADVDRMRLAPLLVKHQFRHELPIGDDLTPDDHALLTQMIARVQHVPMTMLEELAACPTRTLSGWDETTWDFSHQDVMMPRAKKPDVRRSVLKALRISGAGGKIEGSPFYVVTSKVGGCTVRYTFDFGGLWQMRLDASVDFGAGREIRNITLPMFLWYTVIGFDEIMPDQLETAGRVAVQEFKTLDRLLRGALGP